MNCPKIKIIDAILLFAKLYDLEDNYKAILASNATLPRIIEMIIYQMFLNDFNYRECSEEQLFEAYYILFEYARELKEIGEVTFTKN